MTKIVDLRGDTRIMGPTNPNRSVAGITKIARHHSATATGDVWAFQNHWRNQGWGTGGYHEVILRDGSVQLIYRDNVTTNGVGGHNANTYHICLVGSGSFTADQEKVFDERARAAMQRFNLKPTDVLGHNEFSGHASNSCPGTNMAAVRSRLGASGSSTPTPAPNPTYNVEAWNRRQVVSTDVLNVRAAQNTNSAIIKTLRRGQTFNATRITRNGERVNGFTTWFEVDGAGWVSGALVTEVSNTTAATPQPTMPGSNLPDRGSYRFPVNTNIRAAASTNSAKVGMWTAGQTVNYDSKVIRDGRVWLSWIGASGNRRYSAVV
ncbi:SH3 domain-containing protein [Enterococcus sp. OL5]|uniref:SH3 domain-containing protein n=1 Tax=Enterococcus sp. OL5 TaxID=2590214 RepID=UPI001125F1C9|nr:SH3 domain-containing protein [Enterococcus sp. OL5]TPR55401.1 N-acetylmuramoyl-L-alanine amidase [Enterococcus sp. OL5]